MTSRNRRNEHKPNVCPPIIPTTLALPPTYREPEHYPLLSRLQQRARMEQGAVRVPTRDEVERLKRAWLRMPTWDIEYAVGFEAYQEDLAAWHDEQIRVRAGALGCKPLMAAIVEELALCWIRGEPPRSPLALRVLLSYG
jgi:hypothetical protein